MIFWLREKMRHWAEERAAEADAMRRVAEYRAKYPNGYTGPVVEYVRVDGDIKQISSEDPAYPRDKFPRVIFTTMSNTAMYGSAGDGTTPIPFPKEGD